MTAINSSDIVSQAGAPLVIYTELLTWTPTISGQSSAGAGTYTAQNGFYHRVGNIIFVTGSVSWSAHTGTGNILVTNLPFTCRNVANYDPECSVRTDSIAWPAGTTYLFGEFQPGQSFCELWGIRTNNTSQQVQISASGTVHFTGFFLTYDKK